MSHCSGKALLRNRVFLENSVSSCWQYGRFPQLQPPTPQLETKTHLLPSFRCGNIPHWQLDGMFLYVCYLQIFSKDSLAVWIPNFLNGVMA